MAHSKFISKLNWRQILIHFVATWFFIQSFLVLSFLHDLQGWKILAQKLHDESFDFARFYSFYDWLHISPYVGLLVGFIISLSITIKKKLFWLNSMFVLVLNFLLQRFHLSGWCYLKIIFLKPGNYLDHYSAWYFLANGLPMLTIGLLLFFSALTNRFIDGKNPKIANKAMLETRHV